MDDIEKSDERDTILIQFDFDSEKMMEFIKKLPVKIKRIVRIWNE